MIVKLCLCVLALAALTGYGAIGCDGSMPTGRPLGYQALPEFDAGLSMWKAPAGTEAGF